MNLNNVKVGLKVRVTHLESTTGYMIAPQAIAKRKAGVVGEIVSWVSGHGGDVWWVKHEDGDVAPYCFTEFEAA